MGRARWWRRASGRGAGGDHAREAPAAPGTDLDDALATASREAGAGSWADAAVRLARLTVEHPQSAAAHRELARSAFDLATWGGSFATEAGSHPEPVRFVGLDELAIARPGEGVLSAPLATAREAIERALELRPRSVAWLAPLAEIRRAQGDLDGAAEAYEQVVAASETSHSAWVVRSRHLWQFQMEEVHHRRGRPRVDDPLFDASLEPITVPEAARDDGDRAHGVFRARFTHQGLNVGGHLAAPGVEAVDLAIDGRVVRRINLGHGDGVRAFDAVLRRPVLDVAPSVSVLTVTATDGRPLHTRGACDAVRVQLPHGSGRLARLLDEGVTIDKKGGLTPTAEEAAARQGAYLRLYDEVRAFLDTELGRELFVLYGTLLGVHREGELLRGDDDLDCGYVSAAGDPAAVKAEAVETIVALVRGGFSVSINRRGRLFRVHHDAIGDATLHLDVHPVWFEGPDLYVHNHHRFPATVDDLLPVQERELRDGTVLIPHRPEVLLHHFYGPGWRTPDPGYVDDASGVDAGVMARLSEALITPDELRDLGRRLEESARAGGDQGRLVSIATQSLYPLDAFVE